MPITPIGVAMRWMRRPFGRVQSASVRPSGSGSSAMSSRPLAIASTRASVSVEPVAERGGAGAGREIGGVGGEDVGRLRPQGCRHRAQRGVAVCVRRARQHMRGRARRRGGALQMLGGFGLDMHRWTFL